MVERWHVLQGSWCVCLTQGTQQRVLAGVDDDVDVIDRNLYEIHLSIICLIFRASTHTVPSFTCELAIPFIVAL